jgi:hypothetical protein
MSITFLANFKFFFCRIFLSVAGDHASVQLFSSSGVERVIFFFLALPVNNVTGEPTLN